MVPKETVVKCNISKSLANVLKQATSQKHASIVFGLLICSNFQWVTMVPILNLTSTNRKLIPEILVQLQNVDACKRIGQKGI